MHFSLSYYKQKLVYFKGNFLRKAAFSFPHFQLLGNAIILKLIKVSKEKTSNKNISNHIKLKEFFYIWE